MRIPFNKPFMTGREVDYICQAVSSGHISGNGAFTKKCQAFFEERYGFKKCLLTTSCTDALEMAALLTGVGPGDEVIVPSYTFVSSALAFVRTGAKIVFCDSCADQPNIDPAEIEKLITPKTKVIVPVHYAGVACDMDAIMAIAERHGLLVVEDAAQAIDSFYTSGEDAASPLKRPLGSIGHLAAFSFHETKNIISGEGGMLVVNDERFIRRAEILWEKGTNRAEFFRGEVNKYGWVDIGSSFLPSEIVAAFLWAQLENLDQIQNKRKAIWNAYCEGLKPLADKGAFTLPVIPESATNNAHMFYLLFPNLVKRTGFIAQMKEKGVACVFHYLALHSSEFYKKSHGERRLPNCDRYADCLVRLPLFYELEVARVIECIQECISGGGMHEFVRLLKYRCRWNWVRLQLAKRFKCFGWLAPFVAIERKLKGWTDFDTHAITAEIVTAIRPWGKKIRRNPELVDKKRVAFYAMGICDETGGHTKLIAMKRKLLDGVYDMRLFVPDHKYALANGQRLIRLFGSVEGIDVQDAADESSIVRMAQKIIDFNPCVLFAYTAPIGWRDAAVLALIKQCSGIKIIFSHHASHFPNVGIELADVVPSTEKFILSQLRKVNKISDVGSGLTYGYLEDYPDVNPKDVVARRRELCIGENDLCTMSGGSGYKFFDSVGGSAYFEMIRKMLERNADVCHIVISKLNEKQLVIVEKIFGESPVRNRLKFVAERPDYEVYLKCADLFIDSFPMGGAMMIVDLMRLKVPYIVKINRENVLLSFQHNQAEDFEYMYETPKDMLAGIEFLLRNPDARKVSVEKNFKHFMNKFEGRAKRAELIRLIESSDDFEKIIVPYVENGNLKADVNWVRHRS